MRRFEVWTEGFAATGQRGTADLMGTVEAETFSEACAKLADIQGWDRYYDSVNNTYWGCRLFDNESDARRSFG